jgi:predicted small lipoprotein YifL
MKDGLNLRIIVPVLAAFIMAGCGLQDVPYYYPPAVVSASVNYFQIAHDLENYDSASATQDFQGYDIYYRAYQDATQAATANAAVQAEIDREFSSPDQMLAKLTNLGFKQCQNADALSNWPILKEDFSLSNAYVFTIQLDPAGEWYYTIDSNPGKHYLKRSPSASSLGKSFYLKSDYLATDPDYTGSDSPVSLHFVFYAIGYGLDPQNPLILVSSKPIGISSTVDFIYTPQ